MLRRRLLHRPRGCGHAGTARDIQLVVDTDATEDARLSSVATTALSGFAPAVADS